MDEEKVPHWFQDHEDKDIEAFKKLNDKMDEKFGDVRTILIEIKEQTTKTNGRVNKLERWQSFMMGGLAILTILVLPILFIIVSAIISSKF
jgi:hypothetical protein